MTSDAPTPAAAPPASMSDIAVGLRFAYHAEVPPASLDMWTRPAVYSWWWCDRGRASVSMDGRGFTVRPGAWVLFPPHRERRHRIDPGTVFVSVSFEAAWSTGMPLLDMPGPLLVDSGGHASLRDTARHVCEAAQAHQAARSSGTAACRLRGRLLVFAAELFDVAVGLGCVLNTASSGDERLDRVLRQMRARVRAGPLPWSEWSRRAGLSRSQLDRLCRQVHGVSLRQRRDQLLLDELRQRLGAGRESIKQVAASLGFVDTAHLCRWTRNHTGRSPQEIRHESLA